jgi:signal transduction histidine kinase/CheY-like chemotaxis protein/methylphosphotriester-DNA--protein-cysteine methyltransferase
MQTLALLICYCLPASPVRGQYWSDLPPLHPSYVNSFVNEGDSYAEQCFDGAFRDHRGRVWLNVCGVERLINALGLYVFDGYDYQSVQPFLPEGKPLTNPTIFGLNRDGDLVVSGYDDENYQLTLMDPDTRELQRLEIPEKLTRKRNGITGHLFRDGTPLFMTQDDGQVSLYTLREKQLLEEWTGRFPEAKWAESNGHPLWVTPDHYWLMSSTFPLLRIDRSNNTITRFDVTDFDLPPGFTMAVNPPAKRIPKLMEGPDGNLYCFFPGAASSHFLRYEPNEGRFVNLEGLFPAAWQPKDIFTDDRGALCFLFQTPDQQYKAILHTLQNERLDYSPVITELSGRLSMYARDFTREVMVTEDGRLKNIRIQARGAISTYLPGKWISSVMELGKDSLLINVIQEGWLVWNKKTKTYSRFRKPACGLSETPFADVMCQQMIRDDTGNIWMVLKQKLIRYNPGDDICETYNLPRFAKLFTPLSDGRFIIQDQRTHLYMYDSKTRSVVDPGPFFPGEVDDFVRDLFVDSRKWLWVLTNAGLWKIDLEEETSERYGLDDGFTDQRFTAIFEDGDQRIWLGTYASGLYILDPVNGDLINIRAEDGLSNNAVMSMIGDQKGMVWVGTEYGISLLTEKGEIVTSIYKEDGLSYEVFERFDAFRGTDGTLYFGSRNGMNAIDPEVFKENTRLDSDIHIFLSELRYYDRKSGEHKVVHTGFNELPTLHLPPQHPSLHAKFGLSNLIEPQKNRYAYRLRGLSNEWTALGRNPELDIDRLPPGRYTVEIKGSDFRNNESGGVIRIPMVVHEFFFKQPWFYGLVALPFVIFGLIWARNKQLENRRLEAEVARRTEEIRADRDLIEAQAQELQQLDDLKSQFFSNISHELRTPVTLISAPIEDFIQKSTKQLNHESRKRLDMVLRNAHKLKRLVEEILELSRVNNQRVKLQEKAISPTRFCQRLFDAYGAGAGLKSIDYSFESSVPENALYWVDPNRLEKVVNNLLSNALKFTPRHGLIHMQVSLEGDLLHISVRDTGRGIPEEDLPQVFERYFQSEREELASEGGTGIGLSLASELTRLMKGTLTVESTWGKGSTFHLHVPARRAPEDDTSAVRENSPLPAKAISRKPVDTQIAPEESPKILLVEDNPDMQELLRMLLQDQYPLLFAQHGAEAWEWLSQEDQRLGQIDMIISDIMMPHMDGYELLERIKAHPRWQKIPVIMLTARSAEESKLQALRMGVDDYLLKPFSPEELQLRIAKLLSNYRERTAVSAAGSRPAVEIAFTEEASVDLTWLKEVEDAAKEALEKGIKLTTAHLAGTVFLSNRQFSRNLQSLTGLTPNQYIKEIKLQKARHLLESGACKTVEEVASNTGFSSGSYLKKVYEGHFGKSPAEYLR